MVAVLDRLRVRGSAENPQIAGAGALAGRRIGLMGGSFDPAHEGHFHLSLTALRALDLDEVWWLVTPGNPLKDEGAIAPLSERLAVARKIALHPAILVTDVERHLGTRFTVETVARLQTAVKFARFVWLGGADILAEMHRWRDWRALPHLLPIAIFDRPGYSIPALTSRFALEFSWARVDEKGAKEILEAEIPAWTFVFCRRHPGSATAIRKAQA